MKVAIVHDWLDVIGGSEKVVREILKCYPTADVYSLVDHLSDEDRKALGIGKVHTSFIQNLPFSKKRFRNYLPLMPMAIEQFDLYDYDVVISSSHAFGKGVLTSSEQVHLSYVHTPIRYAWDLQHEYLNQVGLKSGVKASIVRAALHYIRLWDRSTSNRPDVFIGNSRFVGGRIEKTYQRDATVIYPPVDTQDMPLCRKKDNFFLAAGRMVPYKRFDMVVEAFNSMPDTKLVVIGDGPEYKKVKALAGPNVEMMGFQSDEVLLDHLQRASCFVFAALEDFGILPVEAQACGTPVIGLGRGGVAETVIHGETGLHFYEQSPGHIAEVVEAFQELGPDFFDPDHIRLHAERFSAQRFREEIMELVDRTVAEKSYTKSRRVASTVPAIVSSPSGIITEQIQNQK
jgi:glycosyltransferase involved in cell wall biosynthesis